MTNTEPAAQPQRLAHTATIVIALTLASRLLGMLRETLLAAHTGLSAQSDAYIAAFKVPDLLYYLIAGGALASCFVPVFSEYRERRDDVNAWKMFSVLFTVISIGSIVLVLILECFTPTFVCLLNRNYPVATVRIAVPLARIILPAQIFFFLGGLLIGVQNSQGKFLMSALSPCVYNLGIILGLTVLYPWLGLSGAMWGGLAGAFAGSFLLQLHPVIRSGARVRLCFDLGHPGVVKVARLMLPVMLGVSLPNVDQMITGYFAGGLAHGAQTALSFANKIMLIPVGIFAQAVGVAVLPTMAYYALKGDIGRLRVVVNRSLGTIFFLTIPASALVYLLAPQIVCLLYQHSRFSVDDTLKTAEPLRYFALGIFAWSASTILTRSFYAMQDSRTPVMSGTVMTGVFVALNLWFMMLGWGIAGLAAATSIAAGLHAFVLYAVLRLKLHGIRIRMLAMSLAKTVAATGALCVAVRLLVSIATALQSSANSPLAAGTLLGSAMACGLAAFGLAARVMRMRELESVLSVARSARRRMARAGLA